MIKTTTTFTQLVRYGVVGLSTNVALYLGYLLLTSAGLGHKAGMTVIYAVGVFLSFALNKQWTFHHIGGSVASFYRYAASYIIGYLFNLATMALFVDYLGFSHELVQAVLIVVTAAMLFLLQKYWVFRRDAPTPRKSIDG